MAPPQPERTGLRRLLAAWRTLQREQRVVVVTALVLLATMLLPWYSLDAFTNGRQQTATKMAITVFSFVEAAIFLVALAVVALVLARGDRRAFHLPGGDGTIVTVAGGWVTFLVFYRFVDKPNAPSVGSTAVVYNLSWGIFFGLLAALALVAAGLRLRAASIAEPAFPTSLPPEGEPAVAVREARPAPASAPATAPPLSADEESRAQRRREREERRRASADTPVRERRPAPPEPDDAPTTLAAPDEAPTRHAAPDEAPTRHAGPDEAPTLIDPTGEEPATRPRGNTSSFEPPEFELPPPRRRPRE